MNSLKLTRRLRIAGRVQGVGYREAMCEAAARLDLTGWVRNRRDGTVEAAVQGDAQAIEAVIAWARRGPSAAFVSGVEVSDDTGAYVSFERRPSE